MPALVLADGTALGVGVFGYWRADAGGIEHVDLVEKGSAGDSWSFGPRVRAGLAASDHGWLAFAWGDVSAPPWMERSIIVKDEIVVVRTEAAGGDTVTRVDPCDGGRCYPVDLSAAFIGERPMLAFAALPSGRLTISVLDLDDPAASVTPVASPDSAIGEVALVSNVAGGLVLWTETWAFREDTASLHVAELDRSGAPTGFEVELESGIDALTFGACSVSGAVAMLTRRGELRLALLDRDLVVTEIGRWSPDEQPPQMACSSSGVWILTATTLRQYDLDGQVRFEEALPHEGFDGRVVGYGGLVAVWPSPPPGEIRRYGCVP